MERKKSIIFMILEGASTYIFSFAKITHKICQKENSTRGYELGTISYVDHQLAHE